VYNIDDEEKDWKCRTGRRRIAELKKVESEQKFTKPPARYTEGHACQSAGRAGHRPVRARMRRRSGRSSRATCSCEEKKVKPTDLGEAVNKLMEE
jgi:DNA topoisomerase IA